MRVFLLFCILGLISCTGSKQLVQQDEVKQLQILMTGSFNSEQQAATDSSYYNISLHMYPIWEDRSGYWLYVEQAVNSMQDKPYRQRIYSLEQSGKNEFISRVYTLENPKDCIEKWKDVSYFDILKPDQITEKAGCAVYLKKKSEKLYVGSTNERDCKSTMRGASYATSKVHIDEKKIESWDQGFDISGKQVWGAERGAYIFDKLD
jgi:hypothetical protein